MFLCGLWHGAAWVFILWGLLHGIYLIGHRIILRGNKPDFSWPKSFPEWAADFFKMFITFHLVALAWVLFRSSSLESTLVYLEGLFRFEQFTGFSTTALFAGGLLIALDVAQTWIGCQTWLIDRSGISVVRYAVTGLLIVSIISASIAHIGTITPFVYFQF